MPRRYRKQSTAAPSGYFAWEARGLRWLDEAGGAAVAEVLGTGPDHLDLEHLTVAVPTKEHAEALGRGLAVTHRAGAPAFGVDLPGGPGTAGSARSTNPCPYPSATG